ncbi:MAG: hypothetical protein KDA25_12840, partial [Phycisphaerales bacterium]|nr:hypothetical protein [Phycisphaerales bacterium]
MVRDEPSRRSVITVVATLAGGVAVVGLMALLATRTHPGAPARFDALVATLVVGAPFALLWILAAAGYGTAIVRPSAPGAARAEAGLVVGVGIAVLLTVDAALGALGVLHLGGGIGGWIVIAGGLGLLGRVVWHARRSELGGAPMDAIVWLAAPAVATLLVAACVAPGWLWATEFGGYDALSYHLGLPAEWVASGRLRPLEHNVYSALPNYVEGAYLHIDLLVGDAVRAAASCQLLHAMFTLLGAWIVGRAAARLAMADDPGARSTVAAIATALVLVTPWVVVVGSLAYDEAAVNLLLATALLALVDPDIGPRRAAALAGVAAGAACGAKLTSVGFVVAPLVACLVITRPARRWAPDLAMMMLGAAVV